MFLFPARVVLFLYYIVLYIIYLYFFFFLFRTRKYFHCVYIIFFGGDGTNVCRTNRRNTPRGFGNIRFSALKCFDYRFCNTKLIYIRVLKYYARNRTTWYFHCNIIVRLLNLHVNGTYIYNIQLQKRVASRYLFATRNFDYFKY